MDEEREAFGSLGALDRDRELDSSHRNKDTVLLVDSNMIGQLDIVLQMLKLAVAAHREEAVEHLVVKGADLRLDEVVEVPNNSVLEDCCSFFQAF